MLMKTLSDLGFFRYVIVHPLNGFWVLKRERRVSVWSAVILFVLFAVSSILTGYFTAYLFAPVSSKRDNILLIAVMSLLPYALWCVSNWCITSLADGEGSFKDIVCATAFGLAPLIITNLLNLGLGYVFSLNEANFYHLISVTGMVWSYALIFFGMMVTQQYTLRKTIFITLLTLAGMAIIVLLAMFMWILVMQVVNCFSDAYSELMLRMRE